MMLYHYVLPGLREKRLLLTLACHPVLRKGSLAILHCSRRPGKEPTKKKMYSPRC